MSKLEYFLKPLDDIKTKDVVVSNRFKDEKGKPAVIKLRSITQSENNAIMKRCTIREKNRQGLIVENLDKTKYNSELILACIVEPNFKSPEFVKAMGVASPSDALDKLFLPGEFAKLTDAVLEIMGLSNDDNNIIEQAKN